MPLNNVINRQHPYYHRSRACHRSRPNHAPVQPVVLPRYDHILTQHIHFSAKGSSMTSFPQSTQYPITKSATVRLPAPNQNIVTKSASMLRQRQQHNPTPMPIEDQTT
ncbi:hypothetical protein PV11_09661 [Exophiala sideris]|uniref:Uncharacterized protein n=1 Tax=Exophiala sideris TaxID=1016849 RepID=A0A0D1YSG8_9EURO|nr:hypothetical protein PV11_09661 [Exophiala sideris]